MIIKILTLSLVITASFSHAQTPEGAKDQTAAQVVKDFYTDYMGKFLRRKNRPYLPASKAFQALIDKNSLVCKEKAEGGICGYGAGGDVYFNAQEIDPRLTVKTSGLKVTEPTPGEVHVTLNVFPRLKNRGGNKGHYDRFMVLKMIREDGRWVVDDILMEHSVVVEKGATSGRELISSRKQIEDEISLYENRK